MGNLFTKIKLRHEYANIWLNAFADGLKKHNVNCSMGDGPADLVVIWSHKEREIIQQQQVIKKDYLVLEMPYVGNRKEWVSAGFNGLNGRADFQNQDVLIERFQKNFLNLLQPWKDQEGYVLVMGQVPGDESLRNVNYAQWVNAVIDYYENAGYEVKFRPHPQARHVNMAVEKSIVGDFYGALAGARQCITFNSSAGVLSVLNGIPTIAVDKGSMAWDVTGNVLTDEKFMPRRDEWCAKLGYTQWNLEELKNGECWEHLRQRYDD